MEILSIRGITAPENNFSGFVTHNFDFPEACKTGAKLGLFFVMEVEDLDHSKFLLPLGDHSDDNDECWKVSCCTIIVSFEDLIGVNFTVSW